MLKKLLKISLAVTCIGAGIFFAKDKMLIGKDSYLSFKSQPSEDETQISGIDAFIDFFNIRRVNPATGIIDKDAVYKAYAQYESNNFYKTGIGSNLKWTEMGPDNIGGRCRAIMIDKDSNNVVYACGVTGGVFKSQDAGSTWNKVGNNPVQNQNAVCMCQASDGAIYYGTGEDAFLFANLSPKGSSFSAQGNYGQGIYKSTNHGYSFTQLASTGSGANGWTDVSTIAVDPSDPKRLYAGNDNSFLVSTDGGGTWAKASGMPTSQYLCKQIKLSKDGKTIYVVIGQGVIPGGSHSIYRSNDGGNTFSQIGKGTVPGASQGIVVAISSSNENTIYASVTDAGGTGLAGLYRSDDKGDTWTKVIGGDTNFTPLTQGSYANALVVDPNTSDKVYIAGLNMFSVQKSGNAYQTTQITGGGAPYYVHVDYHILTFDNAKPYPNMYIGTDGGVFKSTDIGNPSTKSPTFFNADFGFNATQFYGFAVGADDPLNVIGGAQDNGTMTVKREGITFQNGAPINGGDGGYCEISKLNPDLYFGEQFSGSIERSFTRGSSTSWSAFFDGDNAPPAVGGNYSFIAWYSLWESANDPTSIDSVIYTDPVFNHKKGDTVTVESPNGVGFKYVLKADLNTNQSVKVVDPTQSKFFLLNNNGDIWMTRDILNRALKPNFYKIASIPGLLPLMVRATPDGNTAFVVGQGSSGAAIYRITGLSGKKYTGTINTFNPAKIGIVTTKLFANPGQTGTGVAIDENDPNHVIFCSGTYDKTGAHVFGTHNALDTTKLPTFTTISNGIPSMPVYDVLINSHNPNMYLAATELGVYSSMNAGGTWQEENDGMERVPTVMLRQMKYSNKPWGGPFIYAGTFGRGMFYTTTLTTGIEEPGAPLDKLSVKIYPNPARAFTNVSMILPNSSDVNITIYDIQGRALASYDYKMQPSGEHVFNIETSALKHGTYFIKVNAGTYEKTSKILVMNEN